MRKKTFSIFSLLIILSMLLLPAGALQRPAAAQTNEWDLEGVDPAEVEEVNLVFAPIYGKNSDTGLFIVQLVDPPVASYAGSVPGLEATSPSVTGERKLDVNSAQVKAYSDYLLEKQGQLLLEIEDVLGRPVQVEFQYINVLNGFAARMSYIEAVDISSVKGVRAIFADVVRELDTDVGPYLINADDVWDGNTWDGSMTQGEGIIIGVIDTGINYAHPSFADVGGDGYNHTNPYGSGNYVGYCDTTDASYCNDKLIGTYDLHPSGDGDPDDWNGHGSHTASTAGGNRHEAIFDVGSDTYTITIQGVAPHANLISYGICEPGCPSSAAVEAVDLAIADSVDVLNYSISGSDDPWNDPVDLAFLDAFNAGIFVSASAGNDGPGASTVAKTGPWNASVAASTHNRVIAQTLDVDDPTPPADLIGMAVIPGEGTTITTEITDEIRYDPANLNGCSAFPDSFFDGAIALIQRGACTFATKVSNAADVGATAVVVYNNVGGPPITMGGLDGSTPAVFLDINDGAAVKDYIDANAPVTATINPGTSYVENENWQDIIAGFSSRGPSQFSVLAPSYTAPGVNILAAYAADGAETDTYGFLQGTSMSSPHGAGSAALMIALQQDWSPAQVKSSLMLTADPFVVFDSDGLTPADPFDTGAGRLDLAGAGNVGFVLDETHANFEAANPAEGGDPTTLNMPYLVNNDCFLECVWTRTISSTLDTSVDYTVTLTSTSLITMTVDPASFTLGPGATQVISFTADVSALESGVWVFGDVIFTHDEPGAAVPHFPLVVRPTTGVLPESVDITTRRDAGSVLLEDLETFEITDLTIHEYGLTEADLTDLYLSQDPTNGNPYDNLNDGTVFYKTVDVPAGAKRLIAEVFASEAPDIDLYLGLGSTPGGGSQLCSSTTASFIEYCELVDPPGGTYWVLVQSWLESGDPPDMVSLATAVVPGLDGGNMAFDGPSSVAQQTPFDLRFFWDAPPMEGGDRWFGAFSMGTDAGSPGNIGTIPVNILRDNDDVSKTANTDTALPGETVTYTITVQHNVTDDELSYSITDTIPAGMSYVPGSAAVSDGSVSVLGDNVYWDVTMPVPEFNYEVSSSDSNPYCSTVFGGYLNLEDFGIFTIPGVAGDTVGFLAFTSGDPINYYGDDYSGMGFTDDGFAIADIANNWAGQPWVPQTIPDPSFPNNVLAMLWQNLEIVYDLNDNAGISLATAGGPGGYIIIEYDNVEFSGGSADNFDFEIVMSRAVSDVPGAYEIVFAYDNLNGDLSGPLTVGLENVLGDKAAVFLNAGDASTALSDGLMVCFDYQAFGLDPATLTYSATIDPGLTSGTFTNIAEHSVDRIGSKTETTSATVAISYSHIFPIIMRDQ